MKRTVPLKRISDSHLQALGGHLPWSSLPPSGRITPVNPERQAKRKKAYAKKLSAYRKSETYKVVEARSAGQCEALIQDMGRGVLLIQVPPSVTHPCGTPGMDRWIGDRCENAGTDHHHLRYARLGGRELPSDVIAVCRRCHAYFEAQKPAGNRRSRSRSGPTG